MGPLRFYRLFVAVATGILAAVWIVHTWWFGLLAVLSVRIVWAVVEHFTGLAMIDRRFRAHAGDFKQLCGPYGIRLINQAEKDARLRRQLAEVFTNNESRLRKAVETLELMDTLFRAGMRPDGDTYQLHDLKLKYGKYLLEKFPNGTGPPSGT